MVPGCGRHTRNCCIGSFIGTLRRKSYTRRDHAFTSQVFKMRQQKTTKGIRIEDAIPWIVALLALAAAVVLDTPSQPHRWHAAIMWTVCAFTCAVLFGRPRWGSAGFWLFYATFLGIHLFAMWILFGKLLPVNHYLGTVYVAPIGFVEGIAILGLIGRLMGWSSESREKRVRRVAT